VDWIDVSGWVIFVAIALIRSSFSTQNYPMAPARHLITSLLSLASNLLPSIKASALSSSTTDEPEKERCAVAEDLEWLMRTLVRINATLYDAEEREVRDLSVKLWLKELKCVGNQAEDVFSLYRYEETRVQAEVTKASEASGSHKRKQMEVSALYKHIHGTNRQLHHIILHLILSLWLF
jgi:Rx N-terminal domain